MTEMSADEVVKRILQSLRRTAKRFDAPATRKPRAAVGRKAIKRRGAPKKSAK